MQFFNAFRFCCRSIDGNVEALVKAGDGAVFMQLWWWMRFGIRPWHDVVSDQTVSIQIILEKFSSLINATIKKHRNVVDEIRICLAE